MSEIALLVPAPFATVSGGYAYDRRMVEGLRQDGHAVRVIELAGAFPIADARAQTGAAQALASLPEAVIAVIDGLALPAFAPENPALARAVGLIHHPSALETGFSETARADLRALECRLLPRLARVIATSPLTAERLEKEFAVAPARLAVVVPGTDAAVRSHGAGGGVMQVLSVGALVPRKGADVLIRALARLFDLDWRLTIVGSSTRDPAYAGRIRELIAELGLDARVRLVGEVDEAVLDRLWREADIFALATHWEGYGMTVAEALKRGLPVAVCTGGAAAALVPEEAGVFAPPGDEEALSKALRRLIFDHELRRAMAETAWQAGALLPDWPTQVRVFAAALLAEKPAVA